VTASDEISPDDRERAFQVGLAAINAFYGSRWSDLEDDSDFLRGYFERILRRGGYSALAVSSRPKKLESVKDKLKRKCNDHSSDYATRLLNGEPPERIFTDLIGVRITCKFADQVDPIEKLIVANHSLRERDREDYRLPNHYGKFGYAALHIISEPIESTPTQVYFSGCPFEIQVRSALMDIWGVVNWDIGYTEERKIPYQLLRRMSTLSALFHLVDSEFIRIRDEVLSGLSELPSGGAERASSTFQVLTDELTSALAKRSIIISAPERSSLGECFNLATDFYKSNLKIEGRATVEELAVFFLDREKFRWVIDDFVFDLIVKYEQASKSN
jgi:ppGpp synthetase/RelA/SpoT-type nucleotidyltranferase